jgi:hypothetical protein
MIPGKIIRFLEERATLGFAGTRSASLEPRGHRVVGWVIGAGGRTVTALVPAGSVPHLVETLEENGRLALTFEEAGTHETYQLKGRYLGHRPVQPAERDVAARTRERLVKGLQALFPDRDVASLLVTSIGEPRLAVDVEVQEVFLQTPGPGAGARIWPPPDVEAGHP